MHELAGLIENIFKQCNRLIFAEDKRNLEILNESTTFDNGTIRRFVNNVTLTKKFAFRDFEDVMQCSIACFEGLLPEPHNEVVLDLLWDFNVVMAYASLGMHTDSTVASLDSTITQYGMSLRRFVTVTCAAYETREIPGEAEKRRNAEARREEKRLKTGKASKKQGTIRKHDDEDGSRIKEFSMNTIKTHMLTHYPYFIRKFGSLDSYTTRMGEREHVRTKRLYGRTNKRNHEPQMAVHHRRSRMLHSVRVKTRFVEHHKSNGATYVLPDHERLPLSNPKERYQMSASERNPLRLDEFLHDYAGDAALTNSDQGLRSHILCRLLDLSGDEDLPKKTPSSLIFDKSRIYIHRTYRLHYNTYDMRRKAQTTNPRTHPDIMMLADTVTTDEEKHPYRYARVLGIFHANVWLFNSRMRYEDMRVRKVEFLWVRWYELDTTHRHGWKAKRFAKVRFLPVSDPQAFGSVDPDSVLRGAYLEPAFTCQSDFRTT
ncbi:hypothetical protein PQX77_016298 [Marasmius sp. AFHP31]|nr:hypothetical protein PQX77_016298 [Marasmius sp. AFHP31]